MVHPVASLTRMFKNLQAFSWKIDYGNGVRSIFQMRPILLTLWEGRGRRHCLLRRLVRYISPERLDMPRRLLSRCIFKNCDFDCINCDEDNSKAQSLELSRGMTFARKNDVLSAQRHLEKLRPERANGRLDFQLCSYIFLSRHNAEKYVVVNPEKNLESSVFRSRH